MRVLFGTMMLLARSSVEAANTVYTKNGLDWGAICASGDTQGPIKLSTSISSKKEKSNYFHYENVIGDQLG
jgi:hypothetical protein